MRNTKHKNKELEEIGCRTFVCPNINLISEWGKKLELSDKTIADSEYICKEFIKKTYTQPKHTSTKTLIAASLYVGSVMSADRLSEKRSLKDVSLISTITSNSISKYSKLIIETLNIEWNCGFGNYPSSESFEHWKTAYENGWRFLV